MLCFKGPKIDLVEIETQNYFKVLDVFQQKLGGSVFLNRNWLVAFYSVRGFQDFIKSFMRLLKRKHRSLGGHK